MMSAGVRGTCEHENSGLHASPQVEPAACEACIRREQPYKAPKGLIRPLRAL